MSKNRMDGGKMCYPSEAPLWLPTTVSVCCVCVFSFISGYFLVPLVISFWPVGYLGVCYFDSHTSVTFANSPLLLMFNWISVWLESMLSVILLLSNLWRLLSWLDTWSILENSPGAHGKRVSSALGGGEEGPLDSGSTVGLVLPIRSSTCYWKWGFEPQP